MGSFLLCLCVFLGVFYGFVCGQDDAKQKVAWNAEDAHVDPHFIDYSAAFQTQGSPERENEMRNMNKTSLLPRRYLHLPVFWDVKAPLVDKEKIRPTHGSRSEPMPENLKRVLFPPTLSHAMAKPSSGPGDVEVLCTSSKMRVRVNRGVLGQTGLPSQLKLGTCGIINCTDKFFYFSNNISQCGTTKSKINNRVVYSNTLTYSPEEPREGLVRRAAPFTLPIFCHYNRFHYSYKVGYLPQIKTHHFYKQITQRSRFELVACSATWERLGAMEGYVIGQPMYFEARALSVSEDERLFVPTCYVTPSRSPPSALRFTVIENFGCMVDSQFHGSRSRFIRHERGVVRMMMDAFTFEGMVNESANGKLSQPYCEVILQMQTDLPNWPLYMHCKMFVGDSHANDTAKSCTYNTATGSWEELYDAAEVCSCCTSTCATPSSGTQLPDEYHILPQGRAKSKKAEATRATQKMVTSKAWVLEPGGGQVAGTAVVGWDEGAFAQEVPDEVGTHKEPDRPTEKSVEGLAVMETDKEPIQYVPFEDVFGLN